MTSRTPRRIAAALLLASLTCLAPSHASGLRRPSPEGSARNEPAPGLLAFLFRVLDFAAWSGGAMDPNG